MVYLDPKSDIAFKKLFGDITHKSILIDFLNSVLAEQARPKIIDVVFNDPHNIPESAQLKTSIVDVRCTDATGNQYIIEMQVVLQKDYIARAQYYSALGLSRQLSLREQYHKLVPVIFVGVLNFSLFKNPDFISHHLILDTKTLKNELHYQEYHFIELEKFTKNIDQLENVLDKWTFLLKHAPALDEVPSQLKTPELEEAFDVLAQSNWKQAELEAYDRYLDAIRSAKSQLETAEEIGMTKKALAIATALLDVLDAQTIAEKTGLPLNQIEELKRK